MKLSKLYSNFDDVFEPIEFRPGLNVVLAEIRLPENRDKDTHNLGKTTLGILIDFCLLAGKHPQMFLFKHEDKFKNFVFFLEVELDSGGYVTIRRTVEAASKISFKKHRVRNQDFRDLPEEEWDHYKLPFEKSKKILDGYLDLTSFQPWDYRKGLGYFLRTQDDYSDVFQLQRYASKHADWKPFVSQLLGFNARLITDFYAKMSTIEDLKDDEKTIQAELGGSVEDLSKVEGLLLLKQKQADKQQALLDSFDFRAYDKDRTKDLVNKVDAEISSLNQERYTLMYNQKKIQNSLKEGEIFFDPKDAARLFEEAGIFFEGQIKRDYEQLISFNKAITEERQVYLLEEKEEIDARLREVNSEINKLGKRRVEVLAFLKDTDIINKYKRASLEFTELRADVLTLSHQRDHLHRLQELRSMIRVAEDEATQLKLALEEEFEGKNDAGSNSLYTDIRLLFNDIIEDVLDQNALLTVSLNRKYHPEFEAEILDNSGKATSAQRGHTYKKLLCIAFDLAIIHAHIGKGFPSFVYHDGVFESLDKRKKSNLVEVMQRHAEMGIQQIITLIDTDMPPGSGDDPIFSEEEIVLRLHDEGAEGRLFKIDSW